MTNSYAIILKRSNGYCENCGRVGTQRAYLVHRGMGGRHGEAADLIDDPRNSAFSCISCHDLIDGRRIERYEGERAFILSRFRKAAGWHPWAYEAIKKGVVITPKQGVEE